MGTVYEATQEGYRIALKSLNRCSGEQIYRFKQEFRLLADVSHPHVVKVRELFFEDDRWFFTMELVDGLPIDRYVHGLSPAPAPANENTPLAVRPRPHRQEHFQHVRSLFHQLVEGVAAVHRVGLIHRDLKPSNVLVGHGGQLVILDFGLVSGLSLGGVGQTIDGTIAGTPGYLAPELALRGAVTPAGDWYAVGVILYEIMTRQLPLSGTLGELLNKKATEDPLPPSSLCSDIPGDLNDLCVALLQRDPARRPTTDQLLAQCRSWQCPVETPAPAHPHVNDRTVHCPPRFVGRGRILQELTAAYRACAREAQFVLIDGASGLGKTALLSQFEQQLQLIDDPIILRGRCHERERVPYKGLDAIVDSFTRMLLRLSTEQAAQLLPRRIACLARIFPALLRVELFRRVAENEREPEEPLEQQRGAVEALREMFARLADQRPLVLLIDDLHWGDADGLGLLAEVLAPPHAPRMLVVATRQTERPRQSNALSVLMGVRGLAKSAFALEALSAAEARELATLLVSDDKSAAELIASESCGIAFLLVELVQHYRRGSQLEGELSLDNLLSRRVDELSPTQRTALELVAVAGRPVAAAVLERALAHGREQEPADPAELAGQSSKVIDELRRQKLITSGDAHGSLVLYHEGIARAALSKLDPTAVERHCKTLIAALLATDDPDAESLALLFEAVGDNKRAAALTLQTAERAARALAFGYAADLYAKAVELYGQHALSSKLSSLRKDAQPNGAQLYMNVAQMQAQAQTTEPTQVAQLAAQAALQWARSGYVRDGTALLKTALSQAGVHWPQTVLGTQLALGWRRRLARLRDAPAKLRPQAGRNPRALKKLDALYPAYTAFGTFDSLRGAYFASRALPIARQVGDPSRLLNALTAEAIYCAMFDGSRASQRIIRLRSDIRTVAARSCSDIASGDTIDFASCVTAYWEGRWEQVIQQASVSEQRLRGEARRDDARGAGDWEANLLRSVRHTVQRHNGQFADMQAELSAGLLEAQEKRDLYALLDLSRSTACLRLAADDIEALYEAQAEVRRLRREYPATSIDYLLTSLDVSIALYRGDVDTARAEIAQHWRACRKSGLHRSPLLRVLTYGMRLDCALLDQRLTDDMRHVELRVLAKCIEREPVAWAPALAASARAAANALAGDRTAAMRELTCSADRYRTHAMHATSAGVLLRTGALLGGAEGDELSTRATATLRDMNIVSPLRWTRVVHSMY